MSHNSMARLVYMANQIGKFFEVQKHGRVEGIAKHIKAFWDPRMRAQIENHIASTGGEGLDPLVLEALKSLPAVSRTDVLVAPEQPLHH